MRSSCVLLLILLCFVSCRSVKEITESRRDLPNITEGKLFKNIISNELDYNTIYAKKVDLSLKDNKNSHSLKAILRIQRDSFIWVSVSAAHAQSVAESEIGRSVDGDLLGIILFQQPLKRIHLTFLSEFPIWGIEFFQVSVRHAQ